MIKKEFENPEENLKSGDSRVEDWLKNKYGAWNHIGGTGFCITKQTCLDLIEIMEKNKLDSIWGSDLGMNLKNGKRLNYLKLVGNKKLIGLVAGVQDGDN